MNEVRNFVTGELIDSSRARNTLDGYYTDFDTYTRLSHILRKGVLDSGDIVYGLDLEYRLRIGMEKLSGKIKKYSRQHAIPLSKVVKRAIDVEHSRAVAKYKKYRIAINKEEHIDIINSVLKDSFLNEVTEAKEKLDSHTMKEAMPEYFEDVEHFRVF